MGIHSERLEHRTRAMARPVAPTWLASTMGWVSVFAYYILILAAAFNSGI